MPTLSEYVNVYNSALKIIKDKGFRVWKDDHADMFYAEQDGWDFMADNPVSLLGLIALFEHQAPKVYSEYWWKSEGNLDYRSLSDKPPDYVSVSKK